MSYLVKALRVNERVVSFLVDASTRADAEEQVRKRGYAVLCVYHGGFLREVYRHLPRRFSAVRFSRRLLARLAAGFSLAEALDALSARRHQLSDHVAEGLSKAVAGGRSLASALSLYPERFSSLFIAVIQASERAGRLQDGLCRLVDYQAKTARIRKHVLSAGLYPGMLTIFGALIMSLSIFYVIPHFSAVYGSLSGEPSMSSRLLTTLGRFIGAHGLLLGAGFAVLVILVVLSAATFRARRGTGFWICAFPAFAESVRLYEITRLYRTMALLLKSGIPLAQGITLFRPLFGVVSVDRLALAGRLLKEGRPASSALTEARLVTPTAERLLVFGDKSGNMGETMDQIADFHEEDLARWIEETGRLFEPLLLLALGIVVGTVIVLMYMPLLELATTVQS